MQRGTPEPRRCVVFWLYVRRRELESRRTRGAFIPRGVFVFFGIERPGIVSVFARATDLSANLVFFNSVKFEFGCFNSVVWF